MSKKQIQVLIMMLTPYISAVAGAVATWAIVHLHFLALFHFNHDQAASALTNLVVFVIITGLTYLTAHTRLFPELVKWVEGNILHDAPKMAMGQMELKPLLGTISQGIGTGVEPVVTIHNYNASGSTPFTPTSTTEGPAS